MFELKQVIRGRFVTEAPVIEICDNVLLKNGKNLHTILSAKHKVKFRLLFKGSLLALIPLVFSAYTILRIDNLLKSEEQIVDKQFHSVLMLTSVGYLDLIRVQVAVAAVQFQESGEKKFHELYYRFVSEARDQLELVETNLNREDKQEVQLVGFTRRLAIAQLRICSYLMTLSKGRFSMPALSQLIQSSEASTRQFAQMVRSSPILEQLQNIQRQSSEKQSAARKKNEELISQSLVYGLCGSVILSLLMGLYFAREIYARLRSILHNIRQMSKPVTIKAPMLGSDELSILDHEVFVTASSLAQLQVYKSGMLEIITQEMDEPLNEIALVLSRFGDGVYGNLLQSASERITSAARSIDRLRKLVKELCAASETEDDELEMEFNSCDLEEVVVDAVSSVAAVAESKSVHIDVVSRKIELFADRDKLVQVVVNLLSNSIKFSEPNQRVILRVFGDGGTARITVQDFGRGMPAEFVDRLFQRYAQSEAADTSDRKGYGLGLNICKSIVEGHNGKISAASKEGEGSTFTVLLPLMQRLRQEEISKQVESENSSANREVQKNDTAATFPGKRNWLRRMIGASSGVRRAGLLLVSVPLLFQIIFTVVLGVLISQQSNLLDGVFYRYAAVNGCRSILHSAIETGCAAFTYRTLHSLEDRNQYLQARNSTLQQLQLLSSIAKPEDVAAVTALNAYTKDLLLRIDRLATQQTGDDRLGADYFCSPEGKAFIDEMIVKQNPILMFYKKREILEKEFPLTRKEFKDKIRGAIIFALGFDFVIALVLLIVCNRAITRRIETVVNNAQRFRDGYVLSDPLHGADEIAQLDAAIHESAVKVKRLEEFKQAMISVVGHELRAPLASVQALFQLLEAGIMCEARDESSNAALKGQQRCEQLLELIENILDIERIGFGKMMIEQSLIEVPRLLQELGIEDNSLGSMRVNCDQAKLKRAFACIFDALRDMGIEGYGLSVSAKKAECRIFFKIAPTKALSQDVDDTSLFEPFSPRTLSVPRRSRIALQLAKKLIKLNEGSLVYYQTGDSADRQSIFEIALTSW